MNYSSGAFLSKPVKVQMICLCEVADLAEQNRRIIRMFDPVNLQETGRFRPVDYLLSNEESKRVPVWDIEGKRYEVDVQGTYLRKGQRTIIGQLCFKPRGKRSHPRRSKLVPAAAGR